MQGKGAGPKLTVIGRGDISDHMKQRAKATARDNELTERCTAEQIRTRQWPKSLSNENRTAFLSTITREDSEDVVIEERVGRPFVPVAGDLIFFLNTRRSKKLLPLFELEAVVVVKDVMLLSVFTLS